jgi:hypothetical protein
MGTGRTGRRQYRGTDEIRWAAVRSLLIADGLFLAAWRPLAEAAAMVIPAGATP